MIHRYKIKRQLTNTAGPWFTAHVYKVETNGYESLIATVSGSDRDLVEEAVEVVCSRESQGTKRVPIYRYESDLTVDDGLDR